MGKFSSYGQDTAPTTGDYLLSVDTATGQNKRVLFSDLADLLAVTIFPIATIVPYAGAAAPDGFLLCYGQAISRTTYADLFGIISTTYGVGDGSTTFNLPDLRGRVVAGQDDMGGSSANRLTGLTGGVDGDVLGGSGGAESHVLTVAELAAHSHTISQVSIQDTGSGTTVPLGPGGTGNNTATAGSDAAHNNVQPTLILNYIIKT